MRKVVFLLVCVLIGWGAYIVITEGFGIGNLFSIPSYSTVITSSKEVDTVVKQIDDINEIQFAQSKNTLDESIKKYKSTKEEYEALTESIKSDDDGPTISLVDTYDIDFLWTTIGNYSTEEGISLKFNVVKSANSILDTTAYTLCDLKFTVSGNYIPITDFIYDLEDDRKLGFEISEFNLSKGGENLQATFTVNNVPINNKNLTELTTYVTSSAELDEYGNPVPEGGSSTSGTGSSSSSDSSGSTVTMNPDGSMSTANGTAAPNGVSTAQ